MNHLLPWPWVRSFLEQLAQRQKTVWTLFWLGSLVYMIHVTYLVRHYGVEVPTLDDWEMAPLIVKARSGQLTFSDIFAQQQEARTVLRELLEDRFGTLPEAVLQKVATCADQDRLRAAVRQVSRLAKLEDLQL